MTVKKDLEKALAAAESAKGTYATFEMSTDDKSAQQMFQSMSQDMDRHIGQLNSRLGVTAQNQLNAASSATTSDTNAMSSNQQETFQ